MIRCDFCRFKFAVVDWKEFSVFLLCTSKLLLTWTYFDISAYAQIGPARFRAPELLFRPDLIGEECEGIHEVLSFSIQKSDVDLRKTLYSNIVLSGGSTLFKGQWHTAVCMDGSLL